MIHKTVADLAEVGTIPQPTAAATEEITRSKKVAEKL